MKKIFTLAVAALLITGFAFAHEGDKKHGKECGKDKKECKKSDKKEAKAEKKEAKAETKATAKTLKKA